MAKRLVLFINSAELFISHRQHLARGAMAQGYDLTVLVPPGPVVEELKSLGYRCETVPLGRKSIFPLIELMSVFELYKVLRRLQPDILHNFTIKPVLYGTLAARWLGVKQVVNTVTGLGYVFIDSGWKAKSLRLILSVLYKRLFKARHIHFIFQNSDDFKFYQSQGWINPASALQIPGTGVDTDVFRPVERAPGQELTVLFAGRYLHDKGLGELVKASTELWNEGRRFRLLLCGRVDPGNPNSFSADDVATWTHLPFVVDLGFQKNMSAIYQMADIVCLPSYREGIPLTLIEASASGRALLATDVPGCREVVVHEENGLLVPARDVVTLKQALDRLLQDYELRARFAARARTLAMERFEKDAIVKKNLSIYKSA